jgi:hypothetical protein
MSYDGYDQDVGYDVVDEVGAVANQIQKTALARGIKLAPMAAQVLAAKKVAAAAPAGTRVRTSMAGGYGSGMATSCALGTATFAAGTAGGTIVNLAARSEEPFVATKLVIMRNDYAAVPPAVVAGIPVTVLDVRIGQRSILANAAGMPVEAFNPNGTGGQVLGANVVVGRSALITIQFQLGPVAVPAAEACYLTATLMGHE